MRKPAPRHDDGGEQDLFRLRLWHFKLLNLHHGLVELSQKVAQRKQK